LILDTLPKSGYKMHCNSCYVTLPEAGFLCFSNLDVSYDNVRERRGKLKNMASA